MTVREVSDILVAFGILAGLFVSPYYLIKWLRGVDRRAEERKARRLAAEHERTAAGTPGKQERGVLKNCTHCGVFSLTLPYRDKLGRTYCSEACMQWLGEGPRDFCSKCLFETTDDTSGNVHTINGTGTAFVGSSQPCPECSSVVRRAWITLLFIPVIPLRRYRIIQVSRLEFLSRRLQT